MSIAEDKKVDIHNLHLEDQKQPSLVEKWGTRWAEARDKERRGKRNLEIVYAEIEKEVRSNPEDYNIEKITENAVRSAVVISKKYNDIYNEHLDSCKEVDLMGVARDTIADKRASIDGEIKLFLNSYYARNTQDSDLKEAKSKDIKKLMLSKKRGDK